MSTRLTLLLMVLVLCACQVAPTSAPPQPSPPPQTTDVARPTSSGTPLPALTRTPASTLGVSAAELRGVTLSFWHPLFGQSAAAVKALTDDFNQNNIWGIRVNPGAFYNLAALEEMLTLNLKENKLPQVLLAPPEVIADWQVHNTLFAPVSKYVKESEWGLAPKELEDFPVLYQPTAEALSIPIQRSASVLFYNTTWAKELGYRNPPTTPEELRIQACAASKSLLNDDTYENDGLGGWYLDRSPLTLLGWLEAFNASPVNAQTGAVKFNTTPATGAFTFLRKLLDSACAWISPTITALDAFNRRQALFVSASLDEILSQEKIRSLVKSSDEWSILPYPSEHNSPTAFVSGLDGAILLAKPAEQLAAWLFLRWLLLPRSQATLAAAGAGLPVRASAIGLMAEFGTAHPQWGTAAQLTGRYKAAPVQAQWRVARRVLEDAAWQIFQPYVPIARIPAILAEIDTTLQELEQRQP